MNPFNEAIRTASRGLDWSRPCLIWVGDFILAETGRDPAAAYRGREWTEGSALRALVALAEQGQGGSAVSRALDAVAAIEDWEPAEGNQQGAVMVGVFDEMAEHGVPAIFDGTRRWLVARMGAGCLIVPHVPDRMWEVKRA